MAVVKDWTLLCAAEIDSLCRAEYTIGEIREIIEKHCPFKQETAYEEVKSPDQVAGERDA